MFTIVDYTDSTAAAQTDTDIPLATDSHVTVLNSHPLFPIPVFVQWWYAAGLTMTRVRLSTPRLKPIVRPVLQPVDQSATVTDNLRIIEYWRHPIMLNPVEETQMLRSNTTAVAERDHVVLAVGDNQRNIPQGDLYLARATTAFTPTANTWSTGVITLDDTLQVGRYSIVGMRVNDATGIAARLIFPGAPIAGALPQIRPGVRVTASQAQEGIYWMRYGMMGEYGQFESFAVPALEIMDAGPTANPEVFLDIIPVRVGARAQ